MGFPAKKGLLLASAAVLGLAACDGPIDLDLRGGRSLNTSEAATKATADRPDPDARGIISYPGYQVAIARRGDTLGSLAARIGVNAQELAKFNGINVEDKLRKGEVIALPGRVAEPGTTGAQPGGVDITALAGGAIDRADAEKVETSSLPATTQGAQPVRHQVERGETAYTIARLYNVSIKSLAEWNGLGPDFAVREGQYLLIPVALPGETQAGFDPAEAEPEVEAPGEGSPTPLPPSSAKPLPEEDTVAVTDLDKPENQPGDAPDLGKEQTTASVKAARMSYPVRGDIVREYAKGKNDGIDIAAAQGTPVKSADSGTVAAITKDTNGTPIIVVKHANNLLTVYSGVEDVSVAVGDRVGRGEAMAKAGGSAVHFEVRDGFESLDPIPYLTN